MRVGILTFQRAINYGAVLQALALKKTVQKLGHDCELINYRCDVLERGASPFYIGPAGLKDLLVFLFQIRMRLRKNRQFDLFAKKYLDKDKPEYGPEQIGTLSKAYDAYITGSDQVWNYQITGLDEAYFLEFADPQKQRISYAASFGVSEIPEQYKDRYRALLQKIDCISVREKQGADLVKALIDRESTLCIDPVFLLSKEEWREYIALDKPAEEYILVYGINHSEAYRVAQELARKWKVKIVGLQVPMTNRVRCKRIQTESPEEFLGWFCHAKYVVTDSFHGTAFSVIFNKQFTLCTGGETKARMSRQANLLESLGLEGRIYHQGKDLFQQEVIDYEAVNQRIRQIAADSVEFLKDAIHCKENVQ